MNWKDSTVIVPTLNEEASIGRLLELLFASYPGIHVIVADDQSSDGTQRIVQRSRAVLLERSAAKTRGLTASVLDAAERVASEFLVVIDGDLQHPPEKIYDLVQGLRNGHDVVVGVRERVLAPWPWHRRIMSLVASALAQARTKGKVRDPLSGFFGVRTLLFTGVPRYRFQENGYKVLFDFLKASKGLRSAEVPYDFGERQGGKSKIGRTHVIAFLRSLLR